MKTGAWYVVYSKPHRESQLDSHLRSQGFETFYPVIRVKPVNPRSAPVRPYFPRYVFVNFELDEIAISAVKWAPGASHLVEFDGTPAQVPEQVIWQLRKQIDQLEAERIYEPQALKSGDPVRIVRGPLAGYEAIFDLHLSGNERVQIMLTALNRVVRAEVHSRALERKLY